AATIANAKHCRFQVFMDLPGRVHTPLSWSAIQSFPLSMILIHFVWYLSWPTSWYLFVIWVATISRRVAGEGLPSSHRDGEGSSEIASRNEYHNRLGEIPRTLGQKVPSGNGELPWLLSILRRRRGK